MSNTTMPIKIEISSRQEYGKLSSFIGGLICISMSVTALYIVFSGKQLSGGIPFIADSINQLIGQIVFVAGALLTGALAFYAFYSTFKSGKKESTVDDGKS